MPIDTWLNADDAAMRSITKSSFFFTGIPPVIQLNPSETLPLARNVQRFQSTISSTAIQEQPSK
jgi:hypothetical protein